MAYDSYDNAKPDGSVDNGAAFASNTKINLDAVRDAAIMGVMEGWDLTVTAGSGSADFPEFLEYDNGVYRLRLTISYNASDFPDTVQYDYSEDSGSNYDTIGTITYSYDGSNNLTGWSW